MENVCLFLKENGFEIIYSNTDSLHVKGQKEQGQIKELVNEYLKKN